MYNFKVYYDSDPVQGGQVSAYVVSFLMEALFNCGRRLYTDNYYRSVSLATELLTKKTHVIGTLPSNRKYNPKEVVKKLNLKEVMAQESDTETVILKWREKSVVLMLSTVHTDNLKTALNRGGQSEKPVAVLDYNPAKSLLSINPY